MLMHKQERDRDIEAPPGHPPQSDHLFPKTKKEEKICPKPNMATCNASTITIHVEIHSNYALSMCVCIYIYIYISLGGYSLEVRLSIFIMTALMTMKVLAYLHFLSSVDWERCLVLLQKYGHPLGEYINASWRVLIDPNLPQY